MILLVHHAFCLSSPVDRTLCDASFHVARHFGQGQSPALGQPDHEGEHLDGAHPANTPVTADRHGEDVDWHQFHNSRRRACKGVEDVVGNAGRLIIIPKHTTVSKKKKKRVHGVFLKLQHCSCVTGVHCLPVSL